MEELRELTYKSLANAMTHCSMNKHYRACVVFKYEESMIDFLNELEHIDLGENVCTYTNVSPLKMSQTFTIQFNRDSTLVVVAAQDFYTHGRKFNEILYEQGIDEIYIRSELYPTLVRYKAVDGSPFIKELEVEPFDKELMDYLDGFKIIKGE